MKAILVTGAGSGIGRCVAERLAQQGHHVLACARRADDLAALGRIANIEAVELDVTQAAQVERAAACIPKLDGLVNNAGIGGLGWLHTFSDQEFAQILDTNVMGPQRLSRALLPQLLQSRGRIVHIGSQGGSITSRWYGPYTASKHALEAVAECQRMELAPHGVAVSIVQPGGVATGIGAKGEAGMRARFERATAPFDAEAKAVLAQMAAPASAFNPDVPEAASNRRLSTPELVAEAVQDALFSATPRARYLVGSRWEGHRVVQSLLTRLLDANEGPNMQYTRDELVALIDAQLAARG